jgi:predicted Zn-ribbon and HTH transcriptional regulator
MLINKRTVCKECDCTLWSDRAKSLSLCPDCEDVDYDYNQDLESQLENLLEPTQ